MLTLRWDLHIFMAMRAFSVSILLCKMWTLKQELKGFRRDHCCSSDWYVGRKIKMPFSISGSVSWMCNTKLCISLWTSGLISASAMKGVGPEQYFKDKFSELIPRSSVTCSQRYIVQQQNCEGGVHDTNTHKNTRCKPYILFPGS